MSKTYSKKQKQAIMIAIKNAHELEIIDESTDEYNFPTECCEDCNEDEDYNEYLVYEY